MPLQQILPTWATLNNANFTSPTGMSDPETGQQLTGGALNQGDYFDITNQEAQQLSYIKNGLLYGGRYRFVNVDSGATAADVKTGTIGYLRAGSTVKAVLLLTVGASQAAGTYVINGTGGNGTGAQVSVVINIGGTVSTVTLVSSGYGYTSAPTFTIPSSVGGTQGTIIAQMETTPNNVTSYDQSINDVCCPVVFLNSITPGNYGFVQELGIATVLGISTISGGTTGDWVDSSTAGTVARRAGSGSPIGQTVGKALDVPEASALFKIYMYREVVQD